MQKQPEGRETEPTNLGRLRRPANLLVYDNFHPLCSSCGDAETLLAGLWGRTLTRTVLRTPSMIKDSELLFYLHCLGAGFVATSFEH